MSPTNDPSDAEQPIHALAGLETEPSPDFVAKVRRRIHRRTAASQVASFSWHLPKLVLREMTDILREVAGALGGRKDSQP